MKKIGWFALGIAFYSVGFFICRQALLGGKMDIYDTLWLLGIFVAFGLTWRCYDHAASHPWPKLKRLPRIRIEWPS